MAGDWSERAQCYGFRAQPGELWPWDTDAVRGKDAEQLVEARTYKAKAICARCPVRAECEARGVQLDLKTLRPEGIWGGLLPEERAERYGHTIIWISGLRRLVPGSRQRAA